MALDLTILYRGPLSSCNYDCHYCPFAKRHETAAELRVDREQLDRFIDFLASRTDDHFSILFTPWGEAMTRRWYRDGITRLTHMPHLRKVAIQTNLSWDTTWAASCDRSRLGLWCTWHPEQVSREVFLSKCHELDRMEARYSVGVVGMKEYIESARILRRNLHPEVYLWVNAYKDVDDYYEQSDVDAWCEIDPLFRINQRNYRTLDRPCRTGESVISVDGEGTIRRCHFIREPIGNLYEQGFETCLKPRRCSNVECGCHIGYVHLTQLNLDQVFREGLLERIPSRPLSNLEVIDAV